MPRIIIPELFRQIDEVSLLKQDAAVLEIDLVPGGDV